MNVALGQQRWGSKGFKDQMLWDTVLTEEGKKQAVDLSKSIKRKVLPGEIQVIVSSPLTRALQTAELAFDGWDDTPRVVCPLLRERLYLSSDVGVMRSTLTSRFPRCDFSELGTGDAPWWYVPGDEGYVEWRPSGEYGCPGEPTDVFRARLLALKRWIEARPEQTIALVSHWGVAKGLTGQSLHNCELVKTNTTALLLEPQIDGE